MTKSTTVRRSPRRTVLHLFPAPAIHSPATHENRRAVRPAPVCIRRDNTGPAPDRFTHWHPQRGDPIKKLRGFFRRFRKAIKKTFNMLRLTIRRER